ncbi:GbsR/MarR family transcriptional regulator [Maribacter sp. ACAM166]|uniref:GbsR/MarR family transcriptional regulator n=1 Tax=Maribacter sp. ACAM166 TaxID=2508996 RepID=UPI0010FE2AF7|nr:transcriptional regulator [Maribacter sp. ACAM166]TLP71784.1 MarR family transcriptional regulator [Maribacter sp. ACAM166]
MSQKREQEQLIEKIGIGVEEHLNLSPLASRIYALLILSSYEGLTFEEIREVIQASKSSTSVNTNVLTQLGYISFYTKPGDRKRYFKLAKYSSLIELEAYHQSIDIEMDIVKEINAYNKNYHPEKFTNEESLGNVFQEYLKEKQQLVERTITKLRKFRNSEK